MTMTLPYGAEYSNEVTLKVKVNVMLFSYVRIDRKPSLPYVHWNHLEGLLNHRSLSPTFRVLGSVSVG